MTKVLHSVSYYRNKLHELETEMFNKSNPLQLFIFKEWNSGSMLILSARTYDNAYNIAKSDSERWQYDQHVDSIGFSEFEEERIIEMVKNF